MSENGRGFVRKVGLEFDPESGRRMERDASKSLSRVGKASEEAFAGGSREVERFSRQTDAAAASVGGLALILANKASKGMHGFTGLVRGAANQVANLTAVGVLGLSRGLRAAAESTRDASGELSTLGKVADTTASGLETVARVVLTIGGLITGLQLGLAAAGAGLVIAANRAANDFAPSFNRVRTLLVGTKTDVTALRSEISFLAGELGVAGEVANNTLYQVLSALPELANDAAGAMEITRVALEAGSTGFTDAATAAEAITATLNAFSLEAEDAREVADALFAAQDLGVLTFGEVASSIGRVSDLTASLGGEYTDLLGIAATLTPSGTSVAEVFTQIRGAISNILKPSASATAAAERLGIQFNAAALETKGLNGFLLDLIEVTEGNPDVLVEFFGSVEALNLLVALARQTDTLREKTEGIAESAGNTAEKVDLMNDSWERQKELLSGELAAALRDLGMEYEAVGVTGLKVARNLVGAWNWVQERSEQNRADLRARGRELQEEAEAAALPMLPANRAYPWLEGVTVTGVAEIPRPAEPTGIDYSRGKIDELSQRLRAKAIVDLARTGDMEAYERAVREAQHAVNDLVIAEMERLRAAGVEEKTVRQLTSAYQVRAAATADSTEAMRDEIDELARGHELRVLSAEDVLRAMELEQQLRARMQEANLPLRERIRLKRMLLQLEKLGVTMPKPETVGGSLGPPTVETDEDGRAVLPFGEAVPIPDLFEELSYWDDAMLSMQQSASGAAWQMTGAFTGFFEALASGFDTSEAGFHSMADAAIGVGASIIGSMTEGMAQWQMAEGAADLAAGAWPPNPAALAAAGMHFAAAGAFRALGSILAGAGRSAAVPSGIPHSTRDPGLSTAERAEKMGPEFHIYVDGFDPTNPRHQDLVGRGIERYAERHSSINIHPRRRG